MVLKYLASKEPAGRMTRKPKAHRIAWAKITRSRTFRPKLRKAALNSTVSDGLRLDGESKLMVVSAEVLLGEGNDRIRCTRLSSRATSSTHMYWGMLDEDEEL